MRTKRPPKKAVSISADEAVYLLRAGGNLPEPKKPFRLIDLFSGAGGFTLGFSPECGHSFQSVWANDNNEYAAKTYGQAFGDHCHVGDIVALLRSKKTRIPRADVVIGGPPCQGFSLLNKNRKTDPRKQLWRPFFKVVELSKASVFVMENVPQLLGTPEHEAILKVAKRLGFKSVVSAKLCAADYGVPQTRRRAFIIGSRKHDVEAVFPPRRTHFRPENISGRGKTSINGEYVKRPSPWSTVRDAIADLPRPKGTEIGNGDATMRLHFGRNPTEKSIKRYKAIPDQGMNRFDLQRVAPELTPACWIRKKTGGTDLFGRLWWARPAFTIRTEFFKPEKGRYLHPKQHRPLTHREAARLQSFPDDFPFAGTKIEIARQIGNAVPPLLAARIADCVYALLAKTEYMGGRQD